MPGTAKTFGSRIARTLEKGEVKLRVVTEDGAFHLVSLEALETGLAMVCKASVPRPGTPVSRTKEEVTALAQNRHEHALVSNVISPADIGVIACCLAVCTRCLVLALVVV